MLGICTHLGCVPLSNKGNIMDGSAHVMDHITTHPEDKKGPAPTKGGTNTVGPTL